uniref:Nucleotide-diphospho-sugar transferase domain-containing protein n=1 Tax=Panagrolaimus sp. ES5 TaxID=591445 RepID=A0AC34GYC6_9BILA
MTMAHLICLKYLRKRNWKYVILLQNHDVRLKTNAEIVQIFKAFGGANDISASMPGTHTFNKSTNWTFAALNLFKHDAFNQLKDGSGQLFALNLTKSLVQVSISREAVDFVLDELNVFKFIEKIEEKKFGVDELFWGTLNADEALQLPGGYTQNCIVNDTKVFMATRLTVWVSEKYPIIPCSSNYFRRWVCIFGIEDLKNLDNMHHLYVNKLMGEFDFAAVQCMAERVYNRTYFSQNYSINNFDDSVYRNLPHVRYHYRKKTGLSIENFNCTRSSKFK